MITRFSPITTLWKLSVAMETRVQIEFGPKSLCSLSPIQYVGQTGRSLKTRFREHFRNMKKPKTFDTFLYRHFKSNGHLPSKIVIQPIEKIIYDPNSSTRLKI